MNNKILAQGDLDGACFLYSIANAHLALTGKKPTQSQWKKFILNSPFRMEYFLAGEGTGFLRNNSKDFEAICQDFLGSNFIITSDSNVSESTIKKKINNKSVAIVASDNGNHWVCLVEANEEFNIACSAEALGKGIKYKEERSKRFSRPFNKTESFNNLEIWENYAIFVQKNDA